MTHWRWQLETGSGCRVLVKTNRLCSTTQAERDEERAVIFKPICKRTGRPPDDECGLCAKLAALMGIT